MSIVKRIKNNSGSTKFIVTRNVANGDYYDLPYKLWVEVLDNEDLVADVSSGQLVVNDGTSDLSATDGHAWLIRFQKYEPGNFEDAVNYKYSESESTSETSSTSYQRKLRLTTDQVQPGTYRIGWSFEYGIDKNNKAAGFRVNVDGSQTIHEISPEQRKGSFLSITLNSSEGFYQSSGFKVLTLTQGTHNIDIDFKKIKANALIQRARLEFWRISE